MRDTGGHNGSKNPPRILINDRPHFARNGLRNNSNEEIGKFRRALPQFLAVGVKNILLFVYGMTLGFPTIVIPAIQGGDGREPSDIVLNREQISWFSSINLICVPLGCVFSGAYSQPIGKKKAMQIVNLPILASWLLFHFATDTIYLYAGLCLSGVSGGLMEAPVLTYVAEVTEPKYRGLLAASGSACVITGIFVQFILGSILDWRTIAAVSTVFPVISIVALFFVPESPTWLIRQKKFPEAIKALQWLRGWVPEHRIEEEFNSLYDVLITKPEEEAAKDTKTSECMRKLSLFKKRSFLRPFILVLFTFFIGHFSGKTTLQTYAVQIFHTLKAPIDKYHATILLGMAELIGTILCVILIHFTGKRPLVFLSAIGCGLCFFGTATYAYFLNVVPGFAINNVVVNASLLVPKDSIITTDNLTKIFKDEEKALTDALDEEYITTTLPPIDYEENTLAYEENFENETNIVGIMSKRDVSDLDFNITDDFFTFDEEILNATDYDFIENSTQILKEQETDLTTTKETEDSGEDITKTLLVPVPKQKKNKYLWLPLVLLLGSAFFAHIGIRLIPWMLIGEVFPASIRSTASGLAGGIGYIFGFLANKMFLQMLATMTMPGTFWFYSSVAAFGAVVLFFALPETEGRTLSDIEDHFAGRKLPEQDKTVSINGGTHDIELPTTITNSIEHLNGFEDKVVKSDKTDCLDNNEGIENSGFKDDENADSHTTHL